MKGRFAKLLLLLGEDVQSGGNGACTALSISNAIPNRSFFLHIKEEEEGFAMAVDMEFHSCFSCFLINKRLKLESILLNLLQLLKLRPLSPQRKLMWCRKMDWLLCVSDSIVQLKNKPSLQEFPVVINDTDEIEAVPSSSPSRSSPVRLEEKWWLPFPKMEIPNAYLESLPKVWRLLLSITKLFCGMRKYKWGSVLLTITMAFMCLPFHRGKHCLGEVMSCTALEMANRVEDSVHIWKHKYLKRHSLRAKVGKSEWGGKVKGFVGGIEKRLKATVSRPWSDLFRHEEDSFQHNKVLLHLVPCLKVQVKKM
ncbi:hypothetical protein GQ457_13G010550 [Hibiscus cannabinus]